MKNALAAEGLPFCVLRNYSGFPTVNAGNDIDLLLEPSDLPRAVRALRSIRGIQAIAFARRPYVANLFFRGVAAHPDSECRDSKRPSSECPSFECIEIDFDLSLSWKGLPFLAVEEVLSNARPRLAGHVEFLIPAPQHEAIISLFLGLLVSGYVKEKYLPDVQAVFASARQQVHVALAPRFGEAASRQVIDAVVSSDQDRIRACIGPLRRALFQRAFCRRPAQSALAVIRHYARELLLRFSPALATDIAIAGADNSRRTDLIAALAPMLKPWTVILETQSSSAGLLRSIASGWIQKFAPKKHLTIRLYANCCFDWLAKPKPVGSRMHAWRERLAARLSGSPHLLIVLSASGPAEIEFATGKLRCVMLDSSRPIPELAEEAYAAILALLAERAEQRIRRFA